MDGNGEERGVVRAQAEIVVAHFAAGGKMGNAHLVRTIRAHGSGTRLLHPGVNSKGRSTVDGGDAEQLPSPGDRPAERLEKRNLLSMKILRQAQSKDMSHIEGGRPLLRMGVEGILRGGLGDGARTAGDEPANHGTGFVEGF
jgi:hypothetical protein